MTPWLQVGNLECQAFRVLKRLLDQVLQKATTAVAAAKEEPDLLSSLRWVVRRYVCDSLPASQQSRLLSQLIADHQLQCPQVRENKSCWSRIFDRLSRFEYDFFFYPCSDAEKTLRSSFLLYTRTHKYVRVSVSLKINPFELLTSKRIFENRSP